MQHLTEVAAIGISASGVDAVVDPLPDESAVHTIAVEMRVETTFLVVSELTRAIAHGVGELAHKEGKLELAAGLRNRLGARHDSTVADGLDPLHPRIHDGPHVGDGVGVVALVMGEPGRVAMLGPVVHEADALTAVGLVAHRPSDDRGVVLVPFHGALDAVEQAVVPAVVASGVSVPATPLEAVGLQVALQKHPDAVLVAQVEEAGVRWVV